MSITHPERGRESFEQNLAGQFNTRASTAEKLGLGKPDIAGFKAWFEMNKGELETKAGQMGKPLLLAVREDISKARYSALLAETTRTLREQGKLRDSKGKKITGEPYDGKDVYVWDESWTENDTEEGATPKWRYLLTEDHAELPRQGKGKKIGGRKQLETGASAVEYAETLNYDRRYEGETGYIQKDIYTDYLVRLVEENKVSDAETASIALGEKTVAGGFPRSRWLPGFRRFYLDSNLPGVRWGVCGVRVAVRGK